MSDWTDKQAYIAELMYNCRSLMVDTSGRRWRYYWSNGWKEDGRTVRSLIEGGVLEIDRRSGGPVFHVIPTAATVKPGGRCLLREWADERAERKS